MIVTKFNEKLNKISENIYTIEEKITPVDGVYEGTLEHDNVEHNTVNVYTGSKLTGEKINTYVLTTPSLTPWKTNIKIYSNAQTLYITYETTGDTVEAEDINILQDSVNETQTALNDEIARAKKSEQDETTRATNSETAITNNLNAEISRAKASEKTISDNLNNEINRATKSEASLSTSIDNEIKRAKAKESEIDTSLNNRYTKSEVFTKEEVLNKIQTLINNAPDVLDTFGEIAEALGNDPNFATTITTLLSQKVDKVSGKGLSTNDFDNTQKSNLADAYNKRHTHDNKSVIDGITSALVSTWNNAYTHISDTVKHITSSERTLWNTVSNKLDKSANAVSASKLQTARTINGVSFDGSQNIVTPSISTGGNITLHADSDSSTTTEYASIKAGGNELKVTSSGGGSSPAKNNNNLTFNGNVVYHAGKKPTPADIGASATGHTHDDRYYTESEINTKLNGKANASHTHTKSQITDMPTKLSQFTNDAGYITASQVDTSQNHTHANKSVLDGITSANVSNWNSKAGVNYDYQFGEGAGKTAYRKLFTVTPTGTYCTGVYKIQIASRTTGVCDIEVNISSGNDKYIGATVTYEGNSSIASNLRGYLYKNTTTGVTTFEMYYVVPAWDDVKVYHRLLNPRNFTLANNNTSVTALPTNATSTVSISARSWLGNASTSTRATQDSDGKQINTTYVKKGMTWNQLEGV